MRAMFFESRFLPLRQRHLPYASFYRSADLANLVPLVHGFHLEPVILPESLHPCADGTTHRRTDWATQLPHDRCHRSDDVSGDAGVVVQMREKLPAISVRLAQESLAVHEPLLDTAREP